MRGPQVSVSAVTIFFRVGAVMFGIGAVFGSQICEAPRYRFRFGGILKKKNGIISLNRKTNSYEFFILCGKEP